MKIRLLLVAALALVLQAQAKSVSADAARQTAQTWATRGEALGARFGTSVERVAALAVATNATVYAVKMRGGGTVFVSGDDALAPVVAFTAATNDFSTIDKKSPLWALLRRDAEVRAQIAASGAANASAVTPLTTHLSDDPGDLRVAPLVKSQWDQEELYEGGPLCYNRYTPIVASGKHATCGCVATAMSQIMRYHEFPKASRESVTRKCYVNVYLATMAEDPDCVTNLTTQAGVYDWAGMPLVPSADTTDAQCAAIGKLTSDAGISVNMSYGTDSYGSSGAFCLNVPKGLKEAFGYANADYFCRDYSKEVDDVTNYSDAMKRGFLANLDAGYPVLMGISGAGGHAIVGDGYGYEYASGATNLYVHLNMGWSGQDDTWYNLPDVDTAYYHFTVFDDMVCNIFPEDAEKNMLLTGRVTDDEGAAVEGAIVCAYAAGTKTLVAEGATSATGVYGLRVPAGTYDVEVSKKGCPAETLTSVAVAASKSVNEQDYSTFRTFDDGSYWRVYLSYVKISSFGNSQGNDVVITEPRAQIVVGVETNLYSTLDKAIAGGASRIAAGETSVVIELLKDIPLRATATIDYPCELATAAGAADAVVVTRATGASLAVADGGSLKLHDVTFAKGSSTVVSVATGGTLALGAGVDFGVPDAVAAVKTADAAGFVLADVLTAGFSLDCAAAKLVKGVFGSSTLAADVAATSAALIANSNDAYEEQSGSAAADATGAVVLSWANVPVPLTAAAAYFTDKDGATVTARSLDRALETYQDYLEQGFLGDSPEIVVRDRAGISLSRQTTVTNDLVLRGETADVTIDDIGSGAGFVVGEGGSLAVKNLTFDGATRLDGSELKLDTLFLVKGGSLAVKDAVFQNLASTNCYSPAVAVLKGDATVASSAFANCRANGARVQTYGGGGVFVNQGASLALADSVITGCYAATYGGGVFALYGASVTLSGDVTVTDNTSGNFPKKDNLHLVAGTSKEASLTLADAVTGDVGVRWRKTSGTTPRAAAGGVFATAASASVATASADVFTNDADASLEGAADGADLVWEVSAAGDREVPEADAVAVVTPADGGATRYYASLEDAAATLTEDATITMRADDEITGVVQITNAVTLGSASGTTATITRSSSLVISFDASSSSEVTPCVTVAAGGSLVVRDLTLDGSDEEGTMLKSTGGALTLASGATVTGVATGRRVNASAVYVTDGGTFTMESGARVESCANDYSNDALFEYAIGGGVRVSRATAYLKGGTVTSCSSVTGGGVAITDQSTAYVSGDFNVVDNTGNGGTTRDNLLVSNNSTLFLAGELTSEVGVTTGVSANTNVFGSVAADVVSSLKAKKLANSAHEFTNDRTGDTGIAVKSSAGDALLVWSDALDKDGAVEVNGTNYVMVAGGETLSASVTGSTTSFVYNGRAQSPTFRGHGFVVTCEPQTDVGTYTATLTLKKGFKWSDGTTAAKTYAWTIAKAAYDMSGVTFADVTCVYDGKAHSIFISGTLPSGVTVAAYSGNGQTAIGTYTVTVTFAIEDSANYEAVAPMTATLTITDTPTPDPPTPSVTTNTPTPIAFQSITKVSEEDGQTTWQLVVTNRVPWCHYRLIFTDDLSKGFTTTGAWEQVGADADPVWTTNVTTTTEAFFWRAEGKEGEVGE